MEEEQYIKERVDDQITWYGYKSKKNKNYYLLLQILILLFSASLPFLVGQINSKADSLAVITGIIGIFITILTGLNTLFIFKEKWASYRLTAETLKREKILYLTKSANYSDATNSFKDFVDRIEMILSQENMNWKALLKTEKKES